jgi:acylphosphatase
MSDAPTKSVRVVVAGRVQGVWFRAWTQEEATRRGLDGWVRNLSNGSVEALIHGPKAIVNEMLDALWQGPPSSRVDSLTPQSTDEVPAHAGFRIYPTY